jgi:hypothetical protein
VSVIEGRCIGGESIVVWWQCRWKENCDEEAKKKQKKRNDGKIGSLLPNRSLNI